jgi:hypothetical protein
VTTRFRRALEPIFEADFVSWLTGSGRAGGRGDAMADFIISAAGARSVDRVNHIRPLVLWLVIFVSISAASMTACTSSAQPSQSAQSSQSAQLSATAKPSESTRKSVPAQRPAVGTWLLSDVNEVHADSTTIQLRVTRLDCSGGETGTVLQPEVSYEADRIVIRTPVASLPPGSYTCQGNDSVPLTVQLSEAIGGRQLVDMGCVEGPAVSTSLCVDGAVRWRP